MTETGKSLLMRWRKFDTDNPQLFDALVTKAREIKVDAAKRGVNRVSFRLIWELVRYESTWDTVRDEVDSEFKMSNTYVTLYGRAVIEEYPEEFKGFFRTGTSKVDEVLDD